MHLASPAIAAPQRSMNFPSAALVGMEGPRWTLFGCTLLFASSFSLTSDVLPFRVRDLDGRADEATYALIFAAYPFGKLLSGTAAVWAGGWARRPRVIAAMLLGLAAAHYCTGSAAGGGALLAAPRPSQPPRTTRSTPPQAARLATGVFGTCSALFQARPPPGRRWGGRPPTAAQAYVVALVPPSNRVTSVEYPAAMVARRG